MYKCIVENCNKNSKSKTKENYCHKHYTRLIRHGSVNPDGLKQMEHSDICSIDECNNKYMAKGYCNKHYQIFATREPCILKGCNKKVNNKSNGLCATHNIRVKAGADIDSMIKIYYNFLGKCEICETKNPGSSTFHTDHDHKSGIVRGLLCANCNKGLGHFKDDITILNNAIEYLNRSSS